MIRQSCNINSLWAALIVEELVRNGVGQFCISPGSRSTPLTIAAADNPFATTSVFYDERAAAYFAAGYARATNTAAVLICTSGTAVANYFPAVIEAANENLPLLILSADRPSELRDTGANQTIDQPGIFGKYVRRQFDFPCPTPEIPLKYVLTTIDSAIHHTQQSPAGPVHINCMFREPLAPPANGVTDGLNFNEINRWLETSKPCTVYFSAKKNMPDEEIKKAASTINSSASGLIVLGELPQDCDRRAVLRFCCELNWPVFADIQSGLRLKKTGAPFLPYFDQLLLSEKFKTAFNPDTIVQLGDRIVSKRLLQFIENTVPDNYILVADHPYRRDELHQVSMRFDLPIASFCQSLHNHLILAQSSTNIIGANAAAGEQIAKFCQQSHTLNEIVIAHSIAAIIPPGRGLFLGNSMPIRDMDMYGGLSENDIEIAANRGASGIDGNLATACGFAAGLQKPVTVLLGDLAALHDLNSLHLISQSSQQMIIILINNHGGGIFDFLPVAQVTPHFEKFFSTPHEFNFKNAAKMFSIRYRSPANIIEFKQSYQKLVDTGQPAIIEIFTDRGQNRQLHRQLQTRLANNINRYLAD